MGGHVSSLTDLEYDTLKGEYSKNCISAAETILNADFLLLATGAGMSADSGLAVYKDIADIPAYHKMDLNYANICTPDWITENPDLFYGFWGACFNDYRDTSPHDGYTIIQKWRDKYFHRETKGGQSVEFMLLKDIAISTGELPLFYKEKDNCSGELKEKIYKSMEHHLDKVECKENTILPIEYPEFGPDERLPLASSFFVYTSNVDAHSVKSGFSPNEVHEIHGNTEVWQCNISYSTNEDCSSLWTLPKDYRFIVNRDTMLAEVVESLKDDHHSSENYTTSTPQDAQNRPTCKGCGGLARPNVLMFGDGGWRSHKKQSTQYDNWEEAVIKALKQNSDMKMAILEIGCGVNIPTVRSTMEMFLKGEVGSQCTLIRINPDYPHSSNQYDNLISLLGNGLDTIRKIDHHITELTTRREEEETIVSDVIDQVSLLKVTSEDDIKKEENEDGEK